MEPRIVTRRLQRFVDYGILATRPMAPDEPLAGEALRVAAG